MTKWKVKCMSKSGGSEHVVSSHLTESDAEKARKKEEVNDKHSYYWVVKE